MKTGFLAIAFCTLAAAPAFASATCLQQDQIYTWKALSDKTLIVEDRSHDKFKLSLIGVCSNLKFKESLAFKSFGGMGISCLTPGDDVISRDFAMGPSRCAITKIEPYSLDMQKADEAAVKAQLASGH
jgi:hypothetical protein